MKKKVLNNVNSEEEVENVRNNEERAVNIVNSKLVDCVQHQWSDSLLTRRTHWCLGRLETFNATN